MSAGATVQERLRARAAATRRRIVLVEAEDARVQAAAQVLEREALAVPVLLDDDLLALHRDELDALWARLRTERQLPVEGPVQDRLLLGALMVRAGLADGC
ncbi:MAG: phosphate acyltransferase, partial [Mycobacteriales bacterium]